MAAYRRVYDSRHLQADCQEPGSAPEPFARQSSMGYLYLLEHTHTCLTALFPGLHGRAGTRKIKPIWILLKQETLSGSVISWAMCKSRFRQITTPTPHHSSFVQAGCPSCRPTNSVKALQANAFTFTICFLLCYTRSTFTFYNVYSKAESRRASRRVRLYS